MDEVVSKKMGNREKRGYQEIDGSLTRVYWAKGLSAGEGKLMDA